jgi:hypothetical protein
MGTLYDKKEHHLGELRQTYFGLLTILQQFISNDKYTHNHSYLVALYVSALAGRMGFMATSVNISEVGIALANSPGLQVEDRVALRLSLPHTQGAAKIGAEVCWCKPAGFSGMQFVQVPAAVKEQSGSWLASRLNEYLSEEVAVLKADTIAIPGGNSHAMLSGIRLFNLDPTPVVDNLK